MSVYVYHEYLSMYGLNTTVGALVGNPGLGRVMVLLDHRAEVCRGRFTMAEWNEFGRLKDEMQKLFLAAEARLAHAPTPVNPPQAPPPTTTSSVAAIYVRMSARPNTPTQLPPPPPTGFSCCRCQTFNEYAAPNQADGTYLCYGCRP